MPPKSGQPKKLRREISELGEMLGDTIAAIAGRESLELVEVVRRLSRDRREGDAEAGDRLEVVLGSLADEQLRVVIRAFTTFLDLTNLAEDRHRVRVLRERAEKAGGQPAGESIPAALSTLREVGKSGDEIRGLVERVKIALVFTAHPTEAKRRSIRRKLRRIRELLVHRDLQDSAESGYRPINASIRRELAKVWLTDFIRPWRPTILQEVERGLSLKPNLWEVVPRMMDDLREALAAISAGDPGDVAPCVQFGSWIGGDRDGHPYVTTEVTRQTVLWLRRAALEFHQTECRALFESLSLSERQLHVAGLHERIDQAVRRWPELEAQLNVIPPDEVFRRWLAVILWRLTQTAAANEAPHPVEGGYSTSAELESDVEVLQRTLGSIPAGALLVAEATAWLDRVRVFGLHLARLDVRQDSRRYRAVIDELWQKAGQCEAPSTLDEGERQELLGQTISVSLGIDAGGLSEEVGETLALFRLLHWVVARFGYDALGGHVVSMTHEPSDVLSVLWLWHQAGLDREGDGEVTPAPLPIIPLFETINDLQRAPAILEALLKLPMYREHLQQQGNRLTVMLGYSDSTKDGGYLSACWELNQCQRHLHDLAARAGIELTFFHGRGGSLGRGGGPAARSILSLPRTAFQGRLRLTEQGEVLADRYDDPQIAHRHLEQLVWSSLLAAGLPEPEIPAHWYPTMERLSQRSLEAYGQLVNQAGFVEYFRAATPISEVEQLPIGSRPSRRRGGDSLADLRAIPWVFSWTQSRCLIPAWYGLGSALQAEIGDRELLERLRDMYRRWPFFQAMLDNAELALVKTDLDIARRYARLAGDSATTERIADRIATEFAAAKQAILAIVERKQLLAGTPWLKESIRARNRYIDPLNFIQVELLKRLQAVGPGEPDDEQLELRHLTRLTINGLAAGMRTTG